MLQHYCRIQYSQHSIVFQFLSFWKTCVELCLVCKRIWGKMKQTKGRVLTDVVWIFTQNKVHPLFPNAGIRRKQCKDCFSTTWHTVLLYLEASFSFGFRVDLSVRFSRKHCVWISGRVEPNSDEEAVVYLLLRWRCLATLLRHKVDHSTSCCFGFNITAYPKVCDVR